MNFKDMLFADYADMLDLKEATGYSRTTYFPYIKDFIAYCGDAHPDADSITKEMLNKWLHAKHFNSSGSHSSAISRIREFTRYQAAIGKQTYIPSGDYSVKVARYVPYIFTDQELGRLFDAFDSVTRRSNAPEREYIVPVLFRMMYCCGLRPSEPLTLLHEDLDLRTGTIYIRQSKRRKDRRVLMSEELTELCRKYDARSNRRIYFFERKDNSRIPTYWMTHQFRLCWRNSGLEKRLNPRPYDLRHNFATRALMRWMTEGKDVMGMLPYLSAYMGHTEFSATLYYIHLLPERLINCAGIDWERFSRIYPEAAHEED